MIISNNNSSECRNRNHKGTRRASHDRHIFSEADKSKTKSSTNLLRLATFATAALLLTRQCFMFVNVSSPKSAHDVKIGLPTRPHANNNTRKKTKIIGFTNGVWRKVADAWYDRLTSLGYNSHTVLATDEEAVQYYLNGTRPYRAEKVEIPELPKEYWELRWAKKQKKRLHQLFATRWSYILKELQQGNHILLTDVDNIFSRFVPMEEFESSDYDVFHAYETRHPEHIFEEQGFVVCGGMSWLRSDPKVIEFIRLVVEKCGDMCDDQNILNEVVARDLDIEWDSSDNSLRVESNDERFDGLLKLGKSGGSRRTGHRVKIWDRDFAYRGSLEPKHCPKDNWVSMPMIETKVRGVAHHAKLTMFKTWDETCGRKAGNMTSTHN